MTISAGALAQRLLPQRLLCRLVHGVSRSQRRWISRPLIAWFSEHYGVDMSEAERTRLDDYESFNDFFTRALKPGARAIAADPASIASPSDGVLTEFGTLAGDTLLQAKAMTYRLTALLGEESAHTAALVDGHFATIYLAPRNYHRVHAPVTGKLARLRYLPGDRFSVNRTTVAAIAGLFCRNERVVCWFDCAFGPVAVVLVGALNVSSISVTGHGRIESGAAREWRPAAPLPLDKGAELGRFNLGSTVVMVFPRGTIAWREGLADGDEVLMGAEIGRLRGTG